MQALYHWQFNPATSDELVAQYSASTSGMLFDDSEIDRPYLESILHGVVDNESELAGKLDPFLDRPAEQLNPLERAILLIGIYELCEQPDVPWRVIINEAVDLAQAYGAEGGYRYVNAVLDKAAGEMRAAGETT